MTKEQVNFIEHGFRDGLGKLISAIHESLDYSKPSDWGREIQQLHTMTKNLAYNARTIFDGLAVQSFSFYAEAIQDIDDIALPALEDQMRLAKIPLKNESPKKGSEYFL